MSLSPIGASYTPITSTQLQSVGAPQSSVSGQDNDSSPATGAVGSKFAAALSQALSQLGSSAASGTSATSGTTDATAAQDPQQAIAAFAHSLFSALHAQGTQEADGGRSAGSAAGAGSSAAVGGAAGAGHHHHHGGGAGKLETGLQNLIQHLSAPAASGTSTASTDADSSGSDGTGVSTSTSASTSSAANAKLQQSFSNLLAAEGVSGSSASLGTFLQSLASSLQGAPASGNVINTQA